MAGFNNIPSFINRLEASKHEALLAGIVVWHGGVQKTLTGSRSGRSYRIPGTKRSYTASAPGEAPARRTGQLARSYRFQVRGDVGEVGSPLKHAAWLEDGTRRMRPRPHLKRAYKENEAAIKRALGRRID